MKIQQRTESILCFTLAVSVAVVWSGCSSESQPITAQNSKYQVADDQPNSSATPDGGTRPADAPASASRVPNSSTRSPITPAGESGGPAGSPPPKPSVQGPGGTVAAGASAEDQSPLGQIQRLQSQDPRGATREETLGNVLRMQRQIVDLANQVLGSETDETKIVRAAESKISALTLLSQIQPEAQAELKTFVADLKQSPHAQLVRLASRMEFAQRMDAFGSGEAADVAKLLAEFKQLFAEEEKDESLFALSQQVTELFLRAQRSAEATEIMNLVAETFAGHANPQLANAAKMVKEQIALLEVQLDEKVSAVLEGKPKAEEEYLAALDKLLAGEQHGAMALQFLSQVASMIESHSLDLADATYTKISAAYGKNPSEQIVKAVTELSSSFAKRKGIIGQPFVVEGVELDGRPFEWGKFQGKVVLVDFWATWCGPCLAEIPNIRKNYEQYKDQGFEVVGVNLDDNVDDVQRFFTRQKLPWPTVLSSDPQKVGFEHPLAVKCGVQAIPFLVLVDRDGKALALNLRGEKLGEKLASMFDKGPKGPK